MRWEANLLARALDVLREVFEVAEGELVPSFVAVHIRHGKLLLIPNTSQVHSKSRLMQL